MTVAASSGFARLSQLRKVCLTESGHLLRRQLQSHGRPLSPPAKSGRLAGLESLDVMGDGPQNTRRVTIDAVGQNSFTVNDVRIQGSVFLFPHFTTIWNVGNPRDIVPEAFALAKLIGPRPDIVIIGMGRNAHPLTPELRQFFSDLRISVDPMDTKNACHTFNVLNQEGRNVAAAMLSQSVL